MEQKTFITTGRRKQAIARVRLTNGSGNIIINKKKIEDYFPYLILRNIIKKPINKVSQDNKYDIKINVKGGGFKSQAESIQLAISRALCNFNFEYRKSLKKEGLLTRDSRVVERKKPGKKKARKKFQFSKR
jgi:small subunit ribosomal protein S9